MIHLLNAQNTKRNIKIKKSPNINTNEQNALNTKTEVAYILTNDCDKTRLYNPTVMCPEPDIRTLTDNGWPMSYNFSQELTECPILTTP